MLNLDKVVMKLKLIKGWKGEEELITSNPNEYKVKKLMLSLNWEEFNSVSLENDDENWVNVSGNTSSDGLALVYQENGEIYISKKTPKSIDELTEVLVSYLIGNQHFNKEEFVSTIQKPTIQKDSQEYLTWKKRFDEQRKSYKKKKIKVYFASLLILMFSSTFIYLLITDELKFLGHKTEITEAIVTEIQLEPFRYGFIQNVTYEFEYNGIKYLGKFKGTRITGKYITDDIVLVKFSTRKPNVSKRVDYKK